MKIETNGMSLIEELETAFDLVDRCTATIDSGYSLINDERDAAEDLRIICRDYLEAYDKRISRYKS